MQKRSGQIFNRLSSQMKPHCECFSLQHNLLLLNILLNAFWLRPLFFFGSVKEKHDPWCTDKKKNFNKISRPLTFLQCYEFVLIKNDCILKREIK